MPPSLPLTRRDFAKTALLLAAGAASPLAWPLAVPASPPPALSTRPRYRSVSWWLTWDDLTWPNPELMDRIRRRADQCAANGVNCCVIFGAHFRWDFLPLWDRLHDELNFIGQELHQRNILLFDHHSSVLTHRPRNRQEALNIWERNRHHVPFYPSRTEAAALQFNGSHLNDWRMLDVETDAPVYLPTYNAEQYCMNNPAFRDAYAHYVARLKNETAIDGLMSDDGIYYGGWRACGCPFCRARFLREYGRDLPSVHDTNFWGNRRSEAFRDWITMRFKSSGDFLAVPKGVLPPGFPLLTCCASSSDAVLPASGMTYQEFIRNCNHVMLEMTGSTPALTGGWDNRIPTELLHLAIARDHQVPCLGLGYAFFPDTAFFVWAVNKFLGADSWISTLKGRLNATAAELAALPDDPEIAGEGYRWEQAHPRLFTGAAETGTAVYFSRATRDYYGQVEGDYVNDYATSCRALTEAGITCEVVTAVPAFGRCQRLVLSSAACLSVTERTALGKFLHDGGLVIATGPTGHYDERAEPVAHGNPVVPEWLGTFGIWVAVIEPERPGGFPPYDFPQPVTFATCRVLKAPPMRNGWLEVAAGAGRLFWRPERMSDPRTVAAVTDLLRSGDASAMRIKGLPGDWWVREYQDDGRRLIHALPGHVGTVVSATLKNHLSGEPIIEKLKFTPLPPRLLLQPQSPCAQVTLYSPDLSAPRTGRRDIGLDWSLDLSGISRYCVIECVAKT